MKRRLEFMISTLLMALVVVMMTGCNNTETEKKIDGTWRTIKYQEEEGVKIKMVVTEDFHYSESADNTYNVKIHVNIVSPIQLDMCTITYSGTWKVLSDKLIGTLDKKSLHFDFNDAIGQTERMAMETELQTGLNNMEHDGGKILSLDAERLKLKDEKDGTIYDYERVK